EVCAGVHFGIALVKAWLHGLKSRRAGPGPLLPVPVRSAGRAVTRVVPDEVPDGAVAAVTAAVAVSLSVSGR
ncbi:hypothetical protein AB0442_39325, partial [Kitasatospora sp. NPDC085895]|uniref:hypothetical protein n=1 Tax=Kitasatospora sp. NPDC085895 TaxID=3155057 RepID=UPI00344E48F6